MEGSTARHESLVGVLRLYDRINSYSRPSPSARGRAERLLGAGQREYAGRRPPTATAAKRRSGGLRSTQSCEGGPPSSVFRAAVDTEQLGLKQIPDAKPLILRVQGVDTELPVATTTSEFRAPKSQSRTSRQP